MSDEQHICPSCGSEDVYYSRKKSCFVCEDCETTFTQVQPAKQTRSLFFSYGHDGNRLIVDRIKAGLEELGFSVWIDYERINHGDDWRSRITQGVSSSDTVVAFLSSHAYREKGVCQDELRIALCEKCAYIQPILLESPSSFTPPQNITERQWIDMSEWRSFDMESEDFEEWYARKFKELADVLTSKNVADLHGDISLLKKILSPELISAKEVVLLKKDFVGRQWLFDLIREQTDFPVKCIHIIGGAGTGKSACSANMQYHLDNIMGTWYCQWNDCKTTDSTCFVKTMAFKFAVCIDEYRNYILTHSEETRSALNSGNLTEIIQSLIILPLQYTINGNRDCKFFVVDGLDEAEHNGENEILDVLTKIIPVMPDWIKFIVTSRESAEISRRMNLLNIHEIKLDNTEEARADFEYYCTNQCAMDAGRVKGFHGNYLLAELCSRSSTSANGSSNSLNSYYYTSFVKQFENREFTEEERLTFALLINAVAPIPVETFLFVHGDDEDRYLKTAKKIKEYVTGSTEVFQTFWLKRTLSIAHYSLQQWLLSEEAGKYQITKKESLRLVLKFYESLINERSYYLTSSLLENYETFLVKNGYFDILHAKKQDNRYLMIKERLSLSDDYSNKTNRVAHLDASKIKKIDDLSHKISLASHPIHYHAAEPLLHHSGGAMDDYCEYYIFPCCNHYLASDGTPQGITESGCRAHYGRIEDLPAIIELTKQERFEFWKLKLVDEYRRSKDEYQRVYRRIYSQTVTDPESWNRLTKDEQDFILKTVQSTAKTVSERSVRYRVDNIVSKLTYLAGEIGLSDSELETIIAACREEAEDPQF